MDFLRQRGTGWHSKACPLPPPCMQIAPQTDSKPVAVPGTLGCWILERPVLLALHYHNPWLSSWMKGCPFSVICKAFFEQSTACLVQPSFPTFFPSPALCLLRLGICWSCFAPLCALSSLGLSWSPASPLFYLQILALLHKSFFPNRL